MKGDGERTDGGFALAAPSSDLDDNAEWVERPEPGESITGIVLDARPDVGEYDTTLLKVRRTDDEAGEIVLMWSNGQIDRAFEDNGLGVGDEVQIENTGNELEFTDEDGDTTSYFEFNVYYRE